MPTRKIRIFTVSLLAVVVLALGVFMQSYNESPYNEAPPNLQESSELTGALTAGDYPAYYYDENSPSFLDVGDMTTVEYQDIAFLYSNSDSTLSGFLSRIDGYNNGQFRFLNFYADRYKALPARYYINRYDPTPYCCDQLSMNSQIKKGHVLMVYNSSPYRYMNNPSDALMAGEIELSSSGWNFVYLTSNSQVNVARGGVVVSVYDFASGSDTPLYNIANTDNAFSPEGLASGIYWVKTGVMDGAGNLMMPPDAESQEDRLARLLEYAQSQAGSGGNVTIHYESNNVEDVVGSCVNFAGGNVVGSNFVNNCGNQNAILANAGQAVPPVGAPAEDVFPDKILVTYPEAKSENTCDESIDNLIYTYQYALMNSYGVDASLNSVTLNIPNLPVNAEVQINQTVVNADPQNLESFTFPFNPVKTLSANGGFELINVKVTVPNTAGAVNDPLIVTPSFNFTVAGVADVDYEGPVNGTVLIETSTGACPQAEAVELPFTASILGANADYCTDKFGNDLVDQAGEAVVPGVINSFVTVGNPTAADVVADLTLNFSTDEFILKNSNGADVALSPDVAVPGNFVATLANQTLNPGLNFVNFSIHRTSVDDVTLTSFSIDNVGFTSAVPADFQFISQVCELNNLPTGMDSPKKSDEDSACTADGQSFSFDSFLVFSNLTNEDVIEDLVFTLSAEDIEGNPFDISDEVLTFDEDLLNLVNGVHTIEGFNVVSGSEFLPKTLSLSSTLVGTYTLVAQWNDHRVEFEMTFTDDPSQCAPDPDPVSFTSNLVGDFTSDYCVDAAGDQLADSDGNQLLPGVIPFTLNVHNPTGVDVDANVEMVFASNDFELKDSDGNDIAFRINVDGTFTASFNTSLVAGLNSIEFTIHRTTEDAVTLSSYRVVQVADDEDLTSGEAVNFDFNPVRCDLDNGEFSMIAVPESYFGEACLADVENFEASLNMVYQNSSANDIAESDVTFSLSFATVELDPDTGDFVGAPVLAELNGNEKLFVDNTNQDNQIILNEGSGSIQKSVDAESGINSDQLILQADQAGVYTLEVTWNDQSIVYVIHFDDDQNSCLPTGLIASLSNSTQGLSCLDIDDFESIPSSLILSVFNQGERREDVEYSITFDGNIIDTFSSGTIEGEPLVPSADGDFLESNYVMNLQPGMNTFEIDLFFNNDINPIGNNIQVNLDGDVVRADLNFNFEETCAPVVNGVASMNVFADEALDVCVEQTSEIRHSFAVFLNNDTDQDILNEVIFFNVAGPDGANSSIEFDGNRLANNTHTVTVNTGASEGLVFDLITDVVGEYTVVVNAGVFPNQTVNITVNDDPSLCESIEFIDMITSNSFTCYEDLPGGQNINPVSNHLIFYNPFNVDKEIPVSLNYDNDDPISLTNAFRFDSILNTISNDSVTLNPGVNIVSFDMILNLEGLPNFENIQPTPQFTKTLSFNSLSMDGNDVNEFNVQTVQQDYIDCIVELEVGVVSKSAVVANPDVPLEFEGCYDGLTTESIYYAISNGTEDVFNQQVTLSPNDDNALVAADLVLDNFHSFQGDDILSEFITVQPGESKFVEMQLTPSVGGLFSYSSGDGIDLKANFTHNELMCEGKIDLILPSEVFTCVPQDADSVELSIPYTFVNNSYRDIDQNDLAVQSSLSPLIFPTSIQLIDISAGESISGFITAEITPLNNTLRNFINELQDSDEADAVLNVAFNDDPLLFDQNNPNADFNTVTVKQHPFCLDNFVARDTVVVTGGSLDEVEVLNSCSAQTQFDVSRSITLFSTYTEAKTLESFSLDITGAGVTVTVNGYNANPQGEYTSGANPIILEPFTPTEIPLNITSEQNLNRIDVSLTEYTLTGEQAVDVNDVSFSIQVTPVDCPPIFVDVDKVFDRVTLPCNQFFPTLATDYILSDSNVNLIINQPRGVDGLYIPLADRYDGFGNIFIPNLWNFARVLGNDRDSALFNFYRYLEDTELTPRQFSENFPSVPAVLDDPEVGADDFPYSTEDLISSMFTLSFQSDDSIDLSTLNQIQLVWKANNEFSEYAEQGGKLFILNPHVENDHEWLSFDVNSNGNFIVANIDQLQGDNLKLLNFIDNQGRPNEKSIKWILQFVPGADYNTREDDSRTFLDQIIFNNTNIDEEFEIDITSTLIGKTTEIEDISSSGVDSGFPDGLFEIDCSKD